MFTGLIEEVGAVARVQRAGNSQTVEVQCRTVLEGLKPGDSVALDGACQTVTAVRQDSFAVETLAVSLAKTNLGEYRVGRRVNLERALLPTSRLGGHFVQGHVEATAPITRISKDGANVYLAVRLEPSLLRLCIPEGSIALDGISLTIAAITGDTLTVNVIPTTWRETTLQERRIGDRLNVETDMIGRYIARLMDNYRRTP